MKVKSLVVLIALCSTAAFAQETSKEKAEPKVNVPAAAKQAFQKDFPGVNHASWDLEDGDYEAGFKINGIDESAVYDKSGHRKSLEVAVQLNTLPKTATDYLAKKYSAYKITEAAKITTDKNEVTYEAEVGKDGKSWDVIFDATGKFLKQEEGD